MFIQSIIKKQHRTLVSSILQTATQATVANVPVRMFSTPTPDELAKNREEWGEKYSDECFTFEKEWK